MLRGKSGADRLVSVPNSAPGGCALRRTGSCPGRAEGDQHHERKRPAARAVVQDAEEEGAGRRHEVADVLRHACRRGSLAGATGAFAPDGQREDEARVAAQPEQGARQ